MLYQCSNQLSVSKHKIARFPSLLYQNATRISKNQHLARSSSTRRSITSISSSSSSTNTSIATRTSSSVHNTNCCKSIRTCSSIINSSISSCGAISRMFTISSLQKKTYNPHTIPTATTATTTRTSTSTSTRCFSTTKDDNDNKSDDNKNDDNEDDNDGEGNNKATIVITADDNDTTTNTPPPTIDISKYTKEIIIKLPDFIEQGQTAKVSKWYKQSGDIIYPDDTICDIETELFTFSMDVDDECLGIMKEILLEESVEATESHVPLCIILHPAEEEKDAEKKDQEEGTKKEE